MAEALTVERAKSGPIAKMILIMGILFAVYELLFVMGLNFSLYTILRNLGLDFRPLLYAPDIQQSMAFLLGILLLVAFIIYPIRKKTGIEKVPLYDYVLGVMGFASMFYLVIVYPMVVQYGYVEATLLNILIPFMAIALLLEASRRSLGVALPTIALVIMLFGISYEGFNLRRFVNHMFYAREGIFSIPLYVMVSYVFAFVFFGSILEKVGIGDYITKFVMSLVGQRWGGPAKTAVVASALMGTVSGSSVANVLTTGTFTIPLMKRAGYPPEVAGAVEPAASTGGQLMPPIMGAAAFVMAQFLGRPYKDIIIAAAIPAILYFTSVYVFIDRVTKKLGVRPVSRELLPNFRELVRSAYLLSPIPVVTYLLLSGLEPQYSALGAIGAAIMSAWIYQRGIGPVPKLLVTGAIALVGATSYILGLPVSAAVFFAGVLSVFVAVIIGYTIRESREMSLALVKAFDSSLRSTITVFFAASCAGLIQGVLTMTGWATTIGYQLVEISGGNIFVLMVTAMMISLVLGMGVPTTANYIITSTIVGIPMARAIASITGVEFEMAKLVAHMFVFYFGILADLTPPVALASYAGSLLAKSEFWKTALNATKYALAGYLVPYIFTLDPVLLILPASGLNLYVAYRMTYGIANTLLSILMLSAGIVGWHGTHIGLAQRALLVVLGITNLTPYEYLTPVLAAAYVVLYLHNVRRSKHEATKTPGTVVLSSPAQAVNPASRSPSVSS
ncbi:MAG: TRAP transporter fused permease subunit [Zestosphaera sp.]